LGFVIVPEGRGRRTGFLKGGGGGVVFWFSLALHFSALHHMIFHYLELPYVALCHVTTNCCNPYNLLLSRKKTFFACLLNGLPLYFVPHLESRVALLDPHSVIQRKMAQFEM
jgi:hypothetical protein